MPSTFLWTTLGYMKLEEGASRTPLGVADTGLAAVFLSYTNYYNWRASGIQ